VGEEELGVVGRAIFLIQLSFSVEHNLMFIALYPKQCKYVQMYSLMENVN
jgi:predicted nucleic-acid-binding Zn-ribbon protein